MGIKKIIIVILFLLFNIKTTNFEISFDNLYSNNPYQKVYEKTMTLWYMFKSKKIDYDIIIKKLYSLSKCVEQTDLDNYHKKTNVFYVKFYKL